YSIISAADGKEINLLKISHKIHLAIPNVNCATCHEGTATSILSSDVLLPTNEVCLTCHKSDSPELVQSGNLKFILKEPELNFNHKYHTVTRELPCFVCHVNVKDVDILTEANMPPMTTCFNCHNDKVAPTDCSWCHINEDELRPEFHTADWLHKHPFKFNSAVFKPEENCLMCHQENWCQDCHVGSQLAKSSSKSVAPFYQSTERGKKPQSIGRVHSLNYRFLHPIEAKGKDRFCTTCHDFTEFCVECHRDDENQFMPKWHQGSDWAPSIILGGRHADFARRDLERCMGCHDVQGQATICLRCHIDER
ncbi:MAG: cytochrome c3 family protein, partial [Bacteroidetes bacterium]|nr:cytochrome c3 family protein [Bacteroidota bacterium]